MKASNRKGHDALVKSYEEYIKQGESGKAVTNGLIDAVMHMLIGPARLARIKNIEEQRMRIREAYRLFEENHGTGKLYLNDLIAPMANYMLDNKIPKQKTADDDDDDEDDEDFEIINIREPASMGKFYEPPPLKIDDVGGPGDVWSIGLVAFRHHRQIHSKCLHVAGDVLVSLYHQEIVAVIPHRLVKVHVAQVSLLPKRHVYQKRIVK